MKELRRAGGIALQQLLWKVAENWYMLLEYSLLFMSLLWETQMLCFVFIISVMSTVSHSSWKVSMIIVDDKKW